MGTSETDSPRGGGPGTEASPPAELFRREALEFHLGQGEQGNLLRLSPSWTRWTYRLLVAVVVAAALFLTLSRAPVYESGPAVFQVAGRTAISSTTAGTVASVDVLPGEHVEQGQVLVRFGAQRELADLAKNRREWRSQLLELLRDPADEAAGSQVRRLTAERQQLEARVEQRRVRAPRDGAVSDVRIREGQFLQVGDPLLHLVPSEPQYRVVMLLPGQARPLLQAGMEARLEVVGFPYTYVPTAIERVGRQVIGPSEVRRFLGPEIADAIAVTGNVVVVEGRMASSTFSSGDREYGLHDGMLARAQVRVRTERLIVRLVPGLRALMGRSDA